MGNSSSCNEAGRIFGSCRARPISLKIKDMLWVLGKNLGKVQKAVWGVLRVESSDSDKVSVAEKELHS